MKNINFLLIIFLLFLSTAFATTNFEGFESGTLNGYSSDGNVSIVTNIKHSGTYSAKLSANYDGMFYQASSIYRKIPTETFDKNVGYWLYLKDNTGGSGSNSYNIKITMSDFLYFEATPSATTVYTNNAGTWISSASSFPLTADQWYHLYFEITDFNSVTGKVYLTDSSGNMVFNFPQEYVGTAIVTGKRYAYQKIELTAPDSPPSTAYDYSLYIDDTNYRTPTFVYSSGNGSLANPYQINNCSDLQSMRLYLDSNFVMTDNIDCNTTRYTGVGFIPIGESVTNCSANTNSPFIGDFNGNAKVIKNLYQYNDYTGAIFSCMGLFGGTGKITGSGTSAKIHDFGLIDFNIYTKGRYAGAVSGYDHSSDFNNIYTRGKISVQATTPTAYSAGIIGYTISSKLTNTYSDANIFSTKSAFGLTGYTGANGATIKNSYFAGVLKQYTAGYPISSGGTFTNNYCRTQDNNATCSGTNNYDYNAKINLVDSSFPVYQGTPTWNTSLWTFASDHFPIFGNDSSYLVLEELDVNAPTTTISGDSNTWKRTNYSISLSCNDGAGSGCDYTTYRINSGAWQTYTVPFSITADGNNQIDYNSVDTEGNVETIKTAFAPKTVFDVNYNYAKQDNLLMLTSQVTATLFQPQYYRWDFNGVNQSNLQDYNYTILQSSDYNICLFSSDGNATDYNISHYTCKNILLDINSPSTTTTFNSNVSYLTPQTINLTCQDIGGSSCQTTYYKIDTFEWRQGTSVYIYGGGKRKLQYYSIDTAGNIEATKTIIFDINSFTDIFSITNRKIDLNLYYNYNSNLNETYYSTSWYKNSILISSDANTFLLDLNQNVDYNICLDIEYALDESQTGDSNSINVSGNNPIIAQKFKVDHNNLSKIELAYYFDGNTEFRITESNGNDPDNNMLDLNNSMLFYSIINPQDINNLGSSPRVTVDININLQVDKNYWFSLRPLNDDASLYIKYFATTKINPQYSYPLKYWSNAFEIWTVDNYEDDLNMWYSRAYYKIITDNLQTSYCKNLRYDDIVPPENPTIFPNSGTYADYIRLDFNSTDDLQTNLFYYCDINTGSGFQRMSDINGITQNSYLLNAKSYPSATLMNWRCFASDGYNDSNYTTSTDYILINPDTNAPLLTNFIPSSDVSTSSNILSFYVDAVDSETSVSDCKAKIYVNSIYKNDYNAEKLLNLNTWKIQYSGQSDGDIIYANWYCTDSEDNVSPLYSTYRYYYSNVQNPDGSGGGGGTIGVIEVPVVDLNFNPKEIDKYWIYTPFSQDPKRTYAFEVQANQEVSSCFSENPSFDCQVKDGFILLITAEYNDDINFSNNLESIIYVKTPAGLIDSMKVTLRVINLGYYYELRVPLEVSSGLPETLQAFLKIENKEITGIRITTFISIAVTLILIGAVIFYTAKPKK